MSIILSSDLDELWSLIQGFEFETRVRDIVDILPPILFIYLITLDFYGSSHTPCIIYI